MLEFGCNFQIDYKCIATDWFINWLIILALVDKYVDILDVFM